MIQLQYQRIECTDKQTSKMIQVHNKGSTSILYKIRSNDIKAIDACPNFGLLKAQTKIYFQVKILQYWKNNVKLQFLYTEIVGGNEDDSGLIVGYEKSQKSFSNFKKLWGMYHKNQKSKILPVKIVTTSNIQKEGVKMDKSGVKSEEVQIGNFHSIRETVLEAEEEDKEGGKQENIVSFIQNKDKEVKDNTLLKQQKVEEQLIEDKNLITLPSQQVQQDPLQQQKKQVPILPQQSTNKSIQCNNCKNSVSISHVMITAILFFILGVLFGCKVIEQF